MRFLLAGRKNAFPRSRRLSRMLDEAMLPSRESNQLYQRKISVESYKYILKRIVHAKMPPKKRRRLNGKYLSKTFHGNQCLNTLDVNIWGSQCTISHTTNSENILNILITISADFAHTKIGLFIAMEGWLLKCYSHICWNLCLYSA